MIGERMRTKERPLRQVEVILRSAGFVISRRSDVRPSCFDLAARKDKIKMIVKVSPNIMSVRKEHITELKIMAQDLRVAPIIIGRRVARDELVEDAVYLRYGLYVLTAETLRNVVLYGQHPLIEIRQGGSYVRVDGKAIRRRRMELGLSLKKVASITGISRRTVHAHEMGMTRATVHAALRLESALGIPVAVPINIFGGRSEGSYPSVRVRRVRNRFLSMVLRKFWKLGFHATPMRTAPFNFIASDMREVQIIGSIVDKLGGTAEKRVKITSSVADTLGCKPLFITLGRQRMIKGAVVIPWRDFLEIDEPEDLALTA